MPNIVVMLSKGAIGDLKALSNYITPFHLFVHYVVYVNFNWCKGEMCRN